MPTPGPANNCRRPTTKAVLFDLDDTLTDHRHCSRSGLARLQNAHACFRSATIRQLERDHLAILDELHRTVLQGQRSLEQARLDRFRRLFRGYGEEPDDATVELAVTSYRAAYESALRPVPGAVPLLEALRSQVTVGVVTNHLLAGQLDKVKRCRIEKLIDVLVVSEEAGSAKPEPAIFETALDRAGCSAAEAVMVGDSWEVDILGAHAAGIRAVWLNRYELVCPNPALAPEIRALEPVDAVLEVILERAEPAP